MTTNVTVTGTTATVTDDGTTVVVAAASSPAIGVAWGAITGTLSSQTDLDSALAGKAPNDLLTTGEASLPRLSAVGSGAQLVSGRVHLCYRRASRTETIVSLTDITGTTAAAATPTLCKMGVYSVDEGTGDLTLVASTASDTALWAATGTTYTRSLSASYTKTAGVMYAYATLIVTGATAPTLLGLNVFSAAGANVLGLAPAISMDLTGQTDLPASITFSGLTASTRAHLTIANP